MTCLLNNEKKCIVYWIIFLSVCTIWVYHETPNCFSFFSIIYNVSYNLPTIGLLGSSNTTRFHSFTDGNILPMCVRSSSVIFLPTSSPMDYIRQLSFRWWFLIPSLYRSAKQKNHLPMVLQTEFVRQKKKIPAWNIPTVF